MTLTTFLQPLGLLVGTELVIMSVLLSFRDHLDGYAYPWQIPLGFFFVGASTILVVSEFAVAGFITSVGVTFISYLLVGIAGVFVFHYVWFVYPALPRSPIRVR